MRPLATWLRRSLQRVSILLVPGLVAIAGCSPATPSHQVTPTSKVGAPAGNAGSACNATTKVQYQRNETSPGAIAPGGAPDAAHLYAALKDKNAGRDTQYLESMLIGLTLDGTHPAVFCPEGGRLFVQGSDPLTPPVLVDAGFLTLSSEGSALPYRSDRAMPLFWHPATELAKEPVAALVNPFSDKLIYAVWLDSLDPIQPKP
jgi:hypothetical protein